MAKNAYTCELTDGRGDVVYPATKTNVVFDENGISIDDKVANFVHAETGESTPHVKEFGINADTLGGKTPEEFSEKLNFDAIPTQGSNNILSSGTIYTALNQMATNIIGSIGAIMPTGAIIMWSGVAAPAGWHLCDGTDGTPNLKDKFIVGAGNKYALNSTGGEEKVTLTTDEIPSHKHDVDVTVDASNVTAASAGAHSHNITATVAQANSSVVGNINCNNGVGTYTKTTESAGAHTHAISGDFTSSTTESEVGGGLAHNNMPPYYALAFIIKVEE